MKRFLCLLLTLALLSAGCLPAAFAEEGTEPVFSEAVEAEVPEAVDAGDTGLTVEGVETEAPAEVPEEGPAGPIDTEDAGAMTADVPETAIAAAEPGAAATGIQLSATALNVGVKETFQLVVTPLPAGAALPAVTWRSDNEKFVRVDQNGAVTGVKVGSANVYAKFEGGQEVACAVTVLKGPRKLVLNKTNLTLGGDGMNAQLSFTMPSGYASNTFTWSSSNPKVATVDQNGLVTTVGAGKATIMVKAFNGKGGKCKITVLNPPTSIAFPTETFSIALKQTVRLEPTVTFSTKKKKADAAITYAISPNSRDAGCVSLNAATGEITGVRKGSAIITATTYNGKTATLPVTVAAAPTAISLSQSDVYIGAGNVYSGLLANLTAPTGETDVANTVVWTSSNKKVATVDANGIITGHKKGSCVITATTITGLKDTCKVYVYKAPKKVYISPASAEVKVGEVNQYKVSFPKGTGGTVTFTSSNPAIATVTDQGVVTAVAVGEATITVTTFNGKKATAKLTVKSASGSVDLPTQEYDSIDSTTTQYNENMTNAEKLEYVIYCAQSMLGRPYVYGSGYHEDDYRVGFDCSGLVYWCFQRIGVKLKDTAHKQGYDDSQQKITSVASLKRGDIVCFNTVEDGADDLVDHTGIYLGNGKFIHASSSAKKVVISDISGYYSRTFSWGRRVLG